MLRVRREQPGWQAIIDNVPPFERSQCAFIPAHVRAAPIPPASRRQRDAQRTDYSDLFHIRARAGGPFPYLALRRPSGRPRQPRACTAAAALPGNADFLLVVA